MQPGNIVWNVVRCDNKELRIVAPVKGVCCFVMKMMLAAAWLHWLPALAAIEQESRHACAIDICFAAYYVRSCIEQYIVCVCYNSADCPSEASCQLCLWYVVLLHVCGFLLARVSCKWCMLQQCYLVSFTDALPFSMLAKRRYLMWWLKQLKLLGYWHVLSLHL